MLRIEYHYCKLDGYNIIDPVIIDYKEKTYTVLSNIKYTPSPYGASSIDDILDKDGRPLPLILTPQRGVLNISGYGTETVHC